MTNEIAKWIPWLPAIAAALCGLCCIRPGLRKLAAPICIAALAGAFGLSAWAVKPSGHEADIVHAFNWLYVAGFSADFSYYFDPLTRIMLFVVTGIGTLVAIYAAGYMKGERGYARFFAGVALFIFAMTSLVMADNLVLLYLGWEGVGLCSYLLIGFYYDKPSAVAAAKKAFIVNRIGDVGFALGIFLTFYTFETVQYRELFEKVAAVKPDEISFAMQVIPFLLMLGAFGKSAQLPLYVWLPDAMEGPTPVSALIHAATMVTAGVYMIARLLPLFLLSPLALPTVAIVGGLTALFAATIALCQYDIKRIWAYSTISQLGYMFLGVGVLSTVGGVFHLYTHAFFKALLFLTAGSVMHAMAGQLDLRKMSGLRHKMPVTCWLMFLGCLALAGVPGFAGFFSKDLILGDVLAKGISEHNNLYFALAGVGLLTAFLTAFYTFRLWFRVFMGPEQYEMGTEHHGADDHAHGHDDAKGGHDAHAHAHAPHEMPWSMNLPLLVLAIGAVASGYAVSNLPWGKAWISESIAHSSAAVHVAEHGAHAGEHHHPELFGVDAHTLMAIVSSVVAVAGIVLAWYFHLLRREAADRVAASVPDVVRTLANKYYVDELYDALFVQPLRTLGNLCFLVDRVVVDGMVALVGFAPRALGLAAQPAQRGSLQGYGVGMVAGAAFLILLVYWML
jgi:NADH-quinone oxidoreductase subunit L